MKTSTRFRFPKIAVFAFTLVYLVIIVLTYFLYYGGNTKECAQELLLFQGLGFIGQLVLNYFNYRSKGKITILATLFISSIWLFSAISSFFSFRLLCSLYPVVY